MINRWITALKLWKVFCPGVFEYISWLHDIKQWHLRENVLKLFKTCINVL